jgi:hypothetical protein
MKTIILVLALCSIATSAYSQDEFETENKNELGLDVTGFIRFFTQFQASNDFNYQPTYYLTYRRLFENGNIRFGIGGDYDQFENTTPLTDSLTFLNKSSALSTRIGWEWKTKLSKRWSAYYGGDFRFTHSSGDNEAVFFNGGYAVGNEFTANTLGLSPILGFRFKLNDRISLLTEASLSFNYLIYDQKDTSIPITSGLPAQDDIVQPQTNSFYTTFQQPISIYFVFNL